MLGMKPIGGREERGDGHLARRIIQIMVEGIVYPTASIKTTSV